MSAPEVGERLAVGEYDLVAKDAREQLRRWDAGEAIWSIELGGLGPGYEQAIQVLAVEITRDHLDQPLPEKPGAGLWFDTDPNAYLHLRRALRLLHSAIEGGP